ncbi:MAG TPA: type II toxin-antitoxin system RelE/ParE family toxin [Urbifossiella sp.]|jgi:toxin ParE1/3/4|nr:type II toxin-antitoxin system RelE/ParE family toxin [Urbifossiella sp.]
MTPERFLHKSEQATADLGDLVDHYLRNAGPATALRFIDQAERAFAQLLAMPKVGALLGLDELPYEDIRRWHVDGFPHLISLYREVADGVEIIRVLHTSRDIPALFRETGA